MPAITIKAILDTGAAKRSLSELRAALKALESGKGMDSVDKSASKASKSADGTARAVDKVAKGLKGVKTSGLDEASRAASGAQRSVEGTAEAAEKAARNIDGIDGSPLEDVADAAEAAGASIGRVSDAGRGVDWSGMDEGVTTAQRLDGGFTVLKGTLAGLAAEGIAKAAGAAKDVAVEAVEIGKGFESSMSNVSALSGASEEEFEKLEAKARELGASTTFSASQAADALGYMALAGWDTQQMLDGVGPTLTLAQAGAMDLASASDLVTDYLSAFGMQADETNRMVDVLAYSQANANTTVEGLGMAFKNCAANAHAAGLDVETTSAAISMMANQGLKGSEAGTALNAVMRDMTDKMKKGAIEIGKSKVQVMDAEGNYRDFVDIIADVEKATDGMGDAQRASALQSTFTADSIKGINLMLNAGASELGKFREELYGCDGAAQGLADTMTDNLEGDLAAMNSAFEETAIKLYDDVREPLREFVQDVTSNVVPKIEWMIQHFDEWAPKVGAVATAVGLLVMKNKLVKSDAFRTLAAELLRAEAASGKSAAAAGVNATAQKRAAAGAKATATGVKASTVAMNAGRVAAVGLGAALKTIAPLAVLSLLVEGIMAVGGALEESREHGEKMGAATKGLTDAQKAMGDSMAASAAAFEETDGMVTKYGGSLDGVKEKVNEALDSNAQLAESLEGIFSEAGADVGTIEAASRTIEEFAGKSDLSAEQVANLELAVQRVNETCGTTYEVAKDSEGAWQIISDGATVAKESVLELCDAQQLQIQLTANKEAYTAVWKEHADKVSTAAEAQAAYNEKAELYDNLIERQKNGEEGLEGKIRETLEARNEASAALDDANKAMEASQEVLDRTAAAQTLYQMAIDEGAGSMSHAVANNQMLMAALTGAGKSGLDFASDMTAAGVTAEDVAGVNQKVASQIAEAYDGTYSSIRDILANNGIAVDENKEKLVMAAESLGVSLQDMGDKAAEKIPVVQEKLKELVGGAEPTLKDVAQAFLQSGYEIPDSLVQGLAEQTGKPAEQVRQMIDAMALEMCGGDVKAATEMLGHDIDAGLLAGIEGSADLPAGAVGVMSQGTIDKAREILQTHSPSRVFQEIGQNIDQGLVQGVEGGAGSVVASMSKVLTDAVAKARTTASTDMASLGTALAQSMARAQLATATATGGMRKSVTDSTGAMKADFASMGAAQTSMAAIMSSIATQTESSMSRAKSAVQSAVSAMKAAMSFSWSLPHLKVPHVQVTGKFSLEPPSAPNFKVNWYATGGIFDKASVIGVGEAGREAVVPLTRPRLAPFAEAVADELGGGSGAQVVNNYYIDGIQVAPESAAARAIEELARAVNVENRASYGRRGR